MVCDITTDKIDVEVPSPASGRLARILAEPGTTVPVGEPIAEIDTGASPGEAHPEEDSAERHRGEVEIDRSQFYSPVVQADGGGARSRPRPGRGHRRRRARQKRDLLAFIEQGKPSGRAGPAQRVALQAG